MNFENFIARRIAFSKEQNFTAVIVKIAVAAVSLSLAVMIIATATITGFKRDITKKIFGFWGHIHVTDANISRTFEAIPIQRDSELVNQILSIESIVYQKPKHLFGMPVQNQYKEMNTKGGVQKVYAFVLAPTILNTKDEFEGLIIRGVEESFSTEIMNNFMIEGHSIEFLDSMPSDELVISRTTARRLQLEIGEKVILNFIKENRTFKRRFSISGIYKTGLEEYDVKFAMADIRKVQEALGWEAEEIAGYELYLDHIEDLNVINEYIYLDVLPSRLYAETIEEKFPGIFEWLKIQNSNEIVILGLMTFVSILTMITALLILIIEKTNLIGILKSIGASDWSIRKIFLYQAGVILFKGAFWGNLVGLSVCFLQKHFKILTLNEEVYYLSEAPIHVDWMVIVLLNLGVLIIILSSMIIPSALISRISPVRSLRFK